jgi:hypothetical protein
MKRERRLDSPLAPIYEKQPFTLDPSSPPRTHLSPRAHLAYLDTASPPRRPHYLPPQDELSFPHNAKPLPVPPSPTLSSAPVMRPNNTDWFKSPTNYASTATSATLTNFPHQLNDGVTPPQAINPKIRPDPIHLDRPALPKVKKILPTPPDQNSERNKEQYWKTPATIHTISKNHPIVPTTVSHALPPPPSPPLPPPVCTESIHLHIANRQTLNILPSVQIS